MIDISWTPLECCRGHSLLPLVRESFTSFQNHSLVFSRFIRGEWFFPGGLRRVVSLDFVRDS